VDVPLLSKPTEINHAKNTSTIPTEVQEPDRRAGPKRTNALGSGRRVRTNGDNHRNWIKQADRDEGKSAEGLSTDEQEELRELRKKLRELKQERDMLAMRRNSCDTAWFAREKGDVPPKSSGS